MNDDQKKAPQKNLLLEREKHKVKENHFIIEQLVALILDKTKKLIFENKEKNIAIKPDKIKDFNLKKVEEEISNWQKKEIDLAKKTNELNDKILQLKKYENEILELKKIKEKIEVDLKQLQKQIANYELITAEQKQQNLLLTQKLQELETKLADLNNIRIVLSEVNNIVYQLDIIIFSQANEIEKFVTADFIKNELLSDTKKKFQNNLFKFNKIIFNNEKLSNKVLETANTIETIMQYDYENFKHQNAKLLINIIKVTDESVVKFINNLILTRRVSNLVEPIYFSNLIDGFFIKNLLNNSMKESFDTNSFKFVNLLINNKPYVKSFASFLALTIKWVDAKIVYNYKNFQQQEINLKINIFDFPWIIKNFLQSKRHLFRIKIEVNSKLEQLYDKVRDFLLENIPQDILDSFPKNYIAKTFSVYRIMFKDRQIYNNDQDYLWISENTLKQKRKLSLEVVAKLTMPFIYDQINLILDVE